MDQNKEIQNTQQELQEKIGKVYSGTINNIVDYGVFVSLPFASGLVHKSELSWDIHIRPINFRIGDRVPVRVLGTEPTQGKLQLSIKRVYPDPWSETEFTFHIGDQVVGTVAKVTNLGLFINLKNGVDGLLHVSNILDSCRPAYRSLYKPGQRIMVEILSIDKEYRKMSFKEIEI